MHSSSKMLCKQLTIVIVGNFAELDEVFLKVQLLCNRVCQTKLYSWHKKATTYFVMIFAFEIFVARFQSNFLKIETKEMKCRG